MAIKNLKVNLDEGTLQTPANRESTEPETRKGIVMFLEFVSVRKEPSTWAQVVGYIPRDTEVDILEEMAGLSDPTERYYKIRYGQNQIGYMLADYVRRCTY